MMDSLVGNRNGKILESAMSKVDLYSSDNGKKVYKVTQYYTVKTEHFVKVAEGEDPFDIWLDQGGIDHDKIGQDILHEGPHCDAHYAEAFSDDHKVEYLGKVVPEYDEEYKDEIIDYVLDEYAPEKELESA